MASPAHAAHAAGPSLNRLSVSATLHCMTGCVLGEVTGLVIGTALAWGDLATIALAVALAFLFGYTLTLDAAVSRRAHAGGHHPDRPRHRHRLDHDHGGHRERHHARLSSAMEAGLDTLTFWGPMALGFAIAFPFAFAANRYLLQRARATRSCTSTTTPTDSTPSDRRRRRRCGALGPLTAVLAAS
jgi:hypothetical protein